MSDEKPFAEVYEGDRDEMELPSLHIDGIVTVCAHGDDEHDSALAEFVKEAKRINSAVAARERKAAAKALREAAMDADCYAEDTMEHLGHQEGLLSDAIRLRVVKWLRARAAALEGGAT